MDISGLNAMLNTMWKMVKTNGLSEAEAAEINLKIKAAQTVLTAKHNKEIS